MRCKNLGKMYGKSALIWGSTILNAIPNAYTRGIGGAMMLGLIGWDVYDKEYMSALTLAFAMYGGCKIPIVNRTLPYGNALQALASAKITAEGAMGAVDAIRNGQNYGWTFSGGVDASTSVMMGLMMPAYHGHLGKVLGMRPRKVETPRVKDMKKSAQAFKFMPETQKKVEKLLSEANMMGMDELSECLKTVEALKTASRGENIGTLLEQLTIMTDMGKSAFMQGNAAIREYLAYGDAALKVAYAINGSENPAEAARLFMMPEVKVAVQTAKSGEIAYGLRKISEAMGAENWLEGAKEKHAETASVFEIKDPQERKAKIAELIADERARNAYLEGRMNEENAMKTLMKSGHLPDLSGVVWKAIEKSGKADLFEKYSNGELLSAQETNSLITTLKELDTYVEEALGENGLAGAMPAVKSTEIYKMVVTSRASVLESEAKAGKATRDMQLVFGQNNRLLDVFFGVHSGECFGDNPAFSLGRKDIATATLYQNGEVAGGVLFLLRKINGKSSMIIIGVDPSEKVIGTGNSLLSEAKQMELTKWLMDEAYNYAKANGIDLYITASAGGITNRGTTVDNAARSYIGKAEVAFEQSGNFHQSYGYNISGANEFYMPGK